VNATRLILGDCLLVLPALAEGSVDAVCTDPPASISFMGRDWDSDRGGRVQWIAWLARVMVECLRVLKPGGYALVWAIPRRSHWTALALEDAGFFIVDRIAHLFGQGFPKGRGCLKPACEDWWLVRRPGPRVLPLPGLDGCRVAGAVPQVTQGVTRAAADGQAIYGGGHGVGRAPQESNPHPAGRWPANLVLSCACDGEHGPDCPVRLLDEQSGTLTSGKPAGTRRARYAFGSSKENGTLLTGFGDSGGASRFFYCAKASRAEREAGLAGLAEKVGGLLNNGAIADIKRGKLPDPGEAVHGAHGKSTRIGVGVLARNTHPTVKPLALVRWLVRLITPPDGLCLDPFLGSGTTAVACTIEGFRCLGIERESEYLEIARRRLADAEREEAEMLFPAAGAWSEPEPEPSLFDEAP